MGQYISDTELINIPEVYKKLGLEPNQKVADLGCGRTGSWVFTAAQFVGEGGIVYAVDILKQVLKVIETEAERNNFMNVRTVWSDLEIYGAAKIPEGSLDAAFLTNTLYQSHQQGKMVQEAVRLLKPEGKLLVVDWNQHIANFGPAKEHRVDPEVIKKTCEDAGLALLESFEAGQYHFAYIFQK